MTGIQQLILGLISAAISAVLGYLLHKRSKVSDATSAQSGVASNHRAGTAQILEGLNALIDQLQEDNTTFRADIKQLWVRLDAITVERDALRLEVARLRKKYGDNGDTPLPPNK